MAAERIIDNTESLTRNNLDDSIITINGFNYNAQEFMERVLEHTIESEPIDSMRSKNGTDIKFIYNENRQRIRKITDLGITSYKYDINNNLISEVLPDGELVEYTYSLDDAQTPKSITYKKDIFYYIIDDNGIIKGLLDGNNQVVCEYEYDENDLSKFIYEIKGEERIIHKDDPGDNFIGCVNSLRYDGKYYDSETDMFCTKYGSYYDAKANKIIGSGVYVDMKKLFGDQYDTLSTMDKNSNISTLRISPTEIQQLLYIASQYYTYGINEHTGAYTGSNWYTNFSDPSNHYKLAARIIYAENNYNDAHLQTYLKYNRQGVGWEIINRLLEDQYRYNNGKKRTFSSVSTLPTLYDILTYSDAFTSINGNNAKSFKDPADPVYQQAFYIACTIKVCSTFEQWNAVVARPTGVTSQCYNKGHLNSGSCPSADWNNVKFPGFDMDFTDAVDYSAFSYYSDINRFNVHFSYKSENLFIDNVYYP